MAMTVYAKVAPGSSPFTVSPGVKFGAYQYKSDWATFFGSPVMPSRSNLVAIVGAMNL